MKQAEYDPGLTQKFSGRVRRIINQDGTFNVRRNGTTLRDFHPYLQLINMSWPGFLASLLFGFIVINSLFAAAYFFMPTGELHGIEATNGVERFLADFFFSSHTLTRGTGGKCSGVI